MQVCFLLGIAIGNSAAGENHIWAAFEQAPAAQTLRKSVESGEFLSFHQVHPASASFLTAWLARQFPTRPILLITDGQKHQESAFNDLLTWLAQEPTVQRPALFYPAWEALPHEARLPHVDVIGDRLATLQTLLRGPSPCPPLVVASVAALMQKTLPPAFLRDRTRTLRKGDVLEPYDLIEWLEDQGYEPEAQATQKGELALRGGILDLFPLDSPWPVRLEFFGSELESLRYYDPSTQISRETVESVCIPPAGEVGLLRKSGMAPASLIEYLPPATMVIMVDELSLEQQALDYATRIPLGDDFFLPWPDALDTLRQRQMTVIAMTDQPDANSTNNADLSITSLEVFRPELKQAPEAALADFQRREFFQQLHRWLRQDFAVWVFLNTDGERQRFEELWREMGLAESSKDHPQRLRLQTASLSRGFICPAARLVVVTDAEVFGRYKLQRPRRLKAAHAQAGRTAWELDYSDLAVGDYVVHVKHGIGRYLGLQRMQVSRRRSDAKPTTERVDGPECLVIEYAPAKPGQPSPKLYVPAAEAHLVSRYVGSGKAHPQLNSLSGKRWTKTKAQTEEAVFALAAEWLEIQARRATEAGFACAADTTWQREFEGTFIYEETPDQLKAILAAKSDLEMPRPMDRLICGDVGFGKTEVAIRAAFKMVMNGKQVAVLTPTTVLAQQHFNTFAERMAPFPVKVEMLSRFRSPKEQEHILKLLAAGGLDIVIGTHRLVQSDVVFKDLGLVIIDEEQRFGVMHKEKLKRLRVLVDVLTMSATPIPRTLHLALMGARDMSVIETPPADRLPVETIVAQFDEPTIRAAIQHELNRQGQVFYLHNRVDDIEAVAFRIKNLVPQARVVVGHGQMSAHQLEKIMAQFINGQADVLVSTTIIESGLDIPNANTIIIDRADRYGLSDLYQLRGRVGRYKHQAYAYLLIPRHAALLSDARKRISAIRQYSTLGSGFKVAMRDLEIRGAGNLLGTAQSGHINAVGFDLYCQLLKQSVAALKGEQTIVRREVEIRLDFLALHPGEEGKEDHEKKPANDGDWQIEVPREVAVYVSPDETVAEAEDDGIIPREPAYIPYNYIEEPKLRVEVYRKLALASNTAELGQLETEFRDRFGPMPEAMKMLLLLQKIKILAADRGISKLETKGSRLMITRERDFIMYGGKFPRLQKRQARGRLTEIQRFLMQIVPTKPVPSVS